MNPTNENQPPAGQESLGYYEEVLARNLGNKKEAALALLAIHEKKLYRQSHRSFEKYLRERWHMSRARGYQLLDFAKVSTTVDTGQAPKNERQARRKAKAAKPSQPENDEGPTMMVMDYVADVYERLTYAERRDLIYWLRKLLREMEQELDRMQSATPNI